MCGYEFEIPFDKNNVIYIGVNKPTVVINSNKFIDFKRNGVIFNNVIMDENYKKVLRSNINCRISANKYHIVGLNEDGIVVAVSIITWSI
ncbi:MAG: hypothetical protein KatS3mg079_315 [Caloramator sp.]|nr:MAG: hypothetical protein KatS3mg079_315 [Caloramator sp.]